MGSQRSDARGKDTAGKDPEEPLELRARFDALLNRLFQGALVPFVGAGLSMESEMAPANESEGGSRACRFEGKSCEVAVEDRLSTERLRQQLEEECREAGWNDLQRSEKRYFSDLADRLSWTRSFPQIAEAIQARCFVCLEPNTAHRALACLCREQLIEEVITTNWDLCLEYALWDSLPEARPEPARNAWGMTPFRVVRNAKEYRQSASQRPMRPRAGRDGPLICKLNGCAWPYACEDAPANGNELILTTRQLQDFQKRRWARDLLGDRLRSRSILFSGFGSDEPQVRHTVLEVLEELAEAACDREASGSGDPQQDAVRHPAAVTIANYGEGLPFHQQQLLYSYLASIGLAPKPGDPGLNANRLHNLIMSCTFSARDRNEFSAVSPCKSEDNEDQGLRATDFWTTVFSAALARLVVHHTSPSSMLASWLGPPGSASRQWLPWLQERVLCNHGQFGSVLCAPGVFGPAQPRDTKSVSGSIVPPLEARAKHDASGHGETAEDEAPPEAPEEAVLRDPRKIEGTRKRLQAWADEHHNRARLLLEVRDD